MPSRKEPAGRGDGEGLARDFLELRGERGSTWVKRGYSFLFDEQGRWREDRCFCPAEPGRDYMGRGELVRLSLEPRGESCALVRHYRRGGIFGRLLGDGYWGRGRFLREVKVAEWARQRGIPTAEVLALRVERRRLGWYRGDLVTREVPGSRDLEQLLGEVRRMGEGKAAWKRAVIRSLARLLRQMHGAGLYHADLNLKNILVQAGGREPRAVIIDLDRAKVISPLPARLRMRNLVRLYRSLEKGGHLDGTVTTRDLLVFVEAYCGKDRSCRRACKDLLRRGPCSLHFHRAGWRLSRLLAGLPRGGHG